MAGDKRATIGTLIRTTTKIFNVGDALAAYSGDSDFGEEILAWFKDGHKPSLFPAHQRDGDICGGLLVVWNDRSIWKYERTPYPVIFPPQQFAIGSGRDFALAAMHCGKTAREAVQVACEFDSGCGNGIDVLIHNAQSVAGESFPLPKSCTWQIRYY
jgi:hypothetical protein